RHLQQRRIARVGHRKGQEDRNCQLAQRGTLLRATETTMVDQKLKTLQGNSRRSFLRWATAAGAALALDRSKVLDVIADSGGSGLADEGSWSLTCRSVHIVA